MSVNSHINLTRNIIDHNNITLWEPSNANFTTDQALALMNQTLSPFFPPPIIDIIVISSSLTPLGHADLQFIGSASGNEIIDKGVVWNSTGNPSLTNGTIISGGPDSGQINITFVGPPFETAYAVAYATNSAGTVYGTILSNTFDICLAKGTVITLSDLSTKLIENIDYTDNLLVWNFDDGSFSSAAPLWIKRTETTTSYNLLEFSNGSFLKTINQHRIFNKEKGMFTYPMTDDTPVGTTTFNSDGEYITLIKKSILQETVEFYNIITNYHLNMFANGILTSCRLNNIYPISDMMFMKNPDYQTYLMAKSNYESISDTYYNGLRLAEQKIPVDELIKYVNRLDIYMK